MSDKDIDVKNITDDIGKIGASVNEVRDRITVLEDRGESTKELKAQISKMGEDLADKFIDKQNLEGLNKRLDAFNDKMDQIREGSGMTQTETQAHTEKHEKLFREYIQKGCKPELMSEDSKAFYSENLKIAAEPNVEGRVLLESVDAKGGVFVDPVIEAGIIKNITEIDAMRQVASVANITSDRQRLFRRVGTASATWATEQTAASASQPEYANIEIPVHDLSSVIPLSQDLRMDWTSAQSEIISEAGEQFASAEGIAFTTGTGIGRPQGVMLNPVLQSTGSATNINYIVGGGTQLVLFDDLHDLMSGVKSQYLANFTFMFNRTTWGNILNLKQNSIFAWEVNNQTGLPSTIHGRPFVLSTTMADEGNDVYPIVAGDFRAGYRIVDRIGISTLEDPYTSYPAVNFKFLKRVGGQIIKTEALLALQTT